MKAYVSYHVDRIDKSVDMNISYISWEDEKEYNPNMMKFSKDINLDYKNDIDLILGKFIVDAEPNYDKIIFRIVVNRSDVTDVSNLLTYYTKELLYSEDIKKLVDCICESVFKGE